MPMNKTPAGEKKHSPVFLAVFAVFLVTITICVAGTVVGVLEARLAHHDTLWFWASAHLLAHGRDPYDAAAIRRIETAMGLPVGADLPMTRNPPPTLALMLPLGWLGPRIGAVTWSLMLTAFFVITMLLLQGMVDGHYERSYMLLAWVFPPALCCIEVGQTGLITLLGLVLLLRFEKSTPFFAGAALSLCVVKPHLFLPFGAVLLLWIILQKKWLIMLGAVFALLVESAVVTLLDHSVWSHYSAAMRTQQIAGEFVPTLSVALRFLISRTTMWIEFIPAALGTLWGLWYFWRNRGNWDWRTHGSLLTLVSLVAAPYAWFTDQVIALPAMIFVLTRPSGPRKGSITLLMTLMTLAAIDMMVSKSLFFRPDIALAASWLLWYLYATSVSSPGPVPAA